MPQASYQDAVTQNKMTLNASLGLKVSPLTNRWADINKYQAAVDVYLDDIAVQGQELIDDPDIQLDVSPELSDARALIATHGGIKKICRRRQQVFDLVPGDIDTPAELISYAQTLVLLLQAVSLKGDLDPVGFLFRNTKPSVQ